MTDQTQVAIVGAGITGLVTGYHLSAAGVDYRIFEATDRVGGVIRSGRVDGHLLEWGPQRTRMTRTMEELTAALDLSERVVTAPPDLPLFVFRAGRLRRVPFSAAEFLRSDIVSLGGKIRLLAEPLTRAASDDERVADFLIRKVGRPLYENMLGPLYGGLYASDPADMLVGLSLGHVLREFGIQRSLLLPLLRRGGNIDPPVACSFDEGLATLPRALADAQQDRVAVETPVSTLRRTDDGWEIEHASGTTRACEVILTTPAPVTADLLQASAASSAEALRRLNYNPLAVVHLYAETDLRGLGFQVSFAEKLVTRGVTFNDSLFDRKGVYTAYLGGAKAPGIVDRSDAEIAALAIREFRQMTGFDAQTIAVEREWMPAWDYSWRSLDDVSPGKGIHLAANWQSRPGIPGRLAQAGQLAADLTRRILV